MKPAAAKIVLGVLCLVSACATRAEIPWIEEGHSHVTIVVDEDVLTMNPGDRSRRAWLPLYWAAQDLTNYLGKIGGATPPLAARAAEGTLAVRLRVKRPDEPWDAASELGDAYRIDMTANGAELIGETPRAAAYAAYHLLHELGVRWYGPAEWTEIVPKRDRIAFESGVRDFAPDYSSRNLWGDPRWLVRNRMGGPAMPQGHGFHRFMQGMEPRDATPLVERHPEYYPIVDGQVRKTQANLSHPDVRRRAIDMVRATFERNPELPGLSLGPDDGALRDERPASRAMMSGRPDPLSPQHPDATDLLVRFVNSVAEEVSPEFPDKLLAFYVYSNHKSVPSVTPHPMIFPTVAPISYNRYTYIGAPKAPTMVRLEKVMKAWQRLCPRIGFYLYNFNLADYAMPFTRVSTFRRDLPNLHRWGYRYANIESHGNWHTMIPGNYMIGRLLWDVETDVDALLDEFYPLYYGPAAEAMRSCDRLLETAYETASAYAGNNWSMHRILTPEVMSALVRHHARAVEAAGATEPYAKRVSIPGYGLRFAQSWFAAQQALERFDFAAAGQASHEFTATFEAARKAGLTQEGRSQDSFFTRNVLRYWQIFHQRSFDAAAELDRQGRRLLNLPDVWKAWFDPTCIGDTLGLPDPRSSKKGWLDLKTFSANIDEQGFPFFRGLIWYALDIDIPDFELEDNEAVFLWFGGNDSNTRVYLDGQPAGAFNTSNFNPAEIDVTRFLRPGQRRHLVVAVDNRPVYELGTGGIMRPAVFYIRSLREGETHAPEPKEESLDPADRPLFGG